MVQRGLEVDPVPKGAGSTNSNQPPGLWPGFCYSINMNADCLFCKIITEASNLVWHNGNYVAFKDIHPKAKTHLLIVPRAHIASLDDLPLGEAPALLAAIHEVAASQGVKGAYRIQVNVGRAGGQEIDHLHVHLLAG